ncbi:MAG: FliA/WhiG family RNA polymerase sigma factor [Eubacteriales bacterium]
MSEHNVISKELLAELTTEELLKWYKESGDENLKWPLVLRYTDLVKSIALQVRGIYSSFAQVDDIINEGLIVLLSALDKFDLSKGIKFETFASKRVRGAIIDLARRQDWVPRSVRQRSKEIDRASGELFTELGRTPTDDEMAERMGITKEKYYDELSGVALSNVMSLETVFEEREPEVTALGDGAKTKSPEGEVLTSELFEELVVQITELRENEQLVLSLYYKKNLNMKEIAQVMEISEPRVSQIHSKAIQKLRVKMEEYVRSE